MIRTIGRSIRSFKVSPVRLQSTYRQIPKPANKLIGLGLGISTAAALVSIGLNQSINSDATNQNLQSVLVDKNCSEMELSSSEGLLSKYQLLGYGTRAVTFLKMKVYGLGIYIESSDALKIKYILNSKFLSSFYEKDSDKDSLSHAEHLLKGLKDDKVSVILIDNLLLSGIRFTARISPIRNTDFNHLRDGLMKSIKSNDKYKEFMKDAECPENRLIIEGLDQLREVLGRKRGTASKGSILQLEIVEDGKLRFSFKSNDPKDSNEFEEIGTIQNGIVSRLLFLQYLSGPKPLSEETRDRCVDGFISLV